VEDYIGQLEALCDTDIRDQQEPEDIEPVDLPDTPTPETEEKPA
jgi:hypothetical protein